VFDVTFPGGIGADVSATTTTAEPLDNQRRVCEDLGCPTRSGDGVCNRECDSYACGYDGGDCSFGLNPWQNCMAIEKVSVNVCRDKGQGQRKTNTIKSDINNGIILYNIM